jgi:hypothetical protein
MFDTFHWPLTALSIPNKQLINYDRRTKIVMRFNKTALADPTLHVGEGRAMADAQGFFGNPSVRFLSMLVIGAIADGSQRR